MGAQWRARMPGESMQCGWRPLIPGTCEADRGGADLSARRAIDAPHGVLEGSVLATPPNRRSCLAQRMAAHASARSSLAHTCR
jgi:hypothetical protein